jgi:hypothetical protein
MGLAKGGQVLAMFDWDNEAVHLVPTLRCHIFCPFGAQ